MSRYKTHKGTAEWKLTDAERRARRAAKHAVVPLDIDYIQATLTYGVDGGTFLMGRRAVN